MEWAVLDSTAYRERLTAKGRSAKTIRLYLRAVQRAAQACCPLESVSAVDLAAYVDGLPLAYSTRLHLRTALTEYWAMLGVDGPVGAVRVPRKPRGRCLALSEDQARSMVKAAMGWYPQGLAALFGFYLALRSSEIAATRMDRFAPDLSWYTVTGKNDITAALPVHPTLAAEVRAADIDGWLFPGGNGRAHVTGATVWNWVNRVAEAADVDEKVWPHRLRHTALATANDRTGDLRSVADFARHRDTTTTMLYTRTTERNMRRVAEALDYL